MLINCKCHAAKVAPNTNRGHKLACNNLEYNKLKATTLNLHKINSKAKSQIVYKLSICQVSFRERQKFPTQRHICISQTLARTRKKAALESEIRKKRNKPRFSKTLLRIGIEPVNLRFKVSRPPRSTTNGYYTTNTSHEKKQLHMPINCKCYAAKVAPNTNRGHKLACNNLEYNKLNTSTLNLHDKDSKAKSQIVYKLSISKILRDILSWKISEIEFLCCTDI